LAYAKKKSERVREMRKKEKQGGNKKREELNLA